MLHHLQVAIDLGSDICRADLTDWGAMNSLLCQRSHDPGISNVRIAGLLWPVVHAPS